MIRAIHSAPLLARVFIVLSVLVVAWSATNWGYHTFRKPSELFFPVGDAFAKSPPETWRKYGSLFERHATDVITPDFLAALAQVEASGNPVARTYWRWRLSTNPFEVYRPASSAVGMYQITDATFREAKRYCVHDHEVVEEGPWDDVNACWFNDLYTRVLPSHAVEMTAALLDRHVSRILQRRGVPATLRQQHDLAAVIHLCGAGAGNAFAGRGFQTTPGQRCGDHDLATYLAKLRDTQRHFARLSAGT